MTSEGFQMSLFNIPPTGIADIADTAMKRFKMAIAFGRRDIPICSTIITERIVLVIPRMEGKYNN